MPMRQLIQNVAFFTSGGRPRQPFLIIFLPDKIIKCEISNWVSKKKPLQEELQFDSLGTKW